MSYLINEPITSFYISRPMQTRFSHQFCTEMNLEANSDLILKTLDADSNQFPRKLGIFFQWLLLEYSHLSVHFTVHRIYLETI